MKTSMRREYKLKKKGFKLISSYNNQYIKTEKIAITAAKL
jgi:hypothetical protein